MSAGRYCGVMEAENTASSRPGLEVEIQVKGYLNPDWSSRFHNLAISQAPNGCTVLNGHLRDQPELRGLLVWLADLGLDLVSVVTEADCVPVPSQDDLGTRS